MQSINKQPLWLRLLIGIGLPAVCIAGLLVLFFRGSPFYCPFYALTGLYCPGCGSGRAATALVHLDVLTALRNNILFVLYVLPCAYYIAKLYLKIVFGKDNLPWKEPKNGVYIFVILSFILYWILRNLPWTPFTLLAPIPIG